MKTSFLAFIVIASCFFVFWSCCWIWHIQKLKRRGILKGGQNPTLFDVQKLIKEGDTETAIDLYMIIFKADRNKASLAVRDLEKYIHQQNQH